MKLLPDDLHEILLMQARNAGNTETEKRLRELPEAPHQYVESEAKDAERYRWIRAHWQNNSEGWWTHEESPEGLDALIDSCISGEGAK